MNTNYQRPNLIIFLQVLTFILILGPLIISLLFISTGEISLAFLPLLIILALPFPFIFQLLLNSNWIKLKKDIINNKNKPYLIFNYEKEEWMGFINGLYEVKKKGLYKAFLIMIAITLLLFFFKTIDEEIKEIMFFFSLVMLIITINVVFFVYINNIRPLKVALNSSERNIVFYKHGIYIPASNYLIRTFGINNGNHLVSVSSTDSDKNLCFIDVIHDDIEALSDPIEVKTNIIVPRKEHKNSAKNMTKLFKMQ